MYTCITCAVVVFIVAFVLNKRDSCKLISNLFWSLVFGLVGFVVGVIISQSLLSYCIRNNNISETIHDSLLQPLQLSRQSKEDKALIYVIRYTKPEVSGQMSYIILEDRGEEDYFRREMVHEFRPKLIKESDSAHNGVYRVRTVTAKGIMKHFTIGSRDIKTLIVPIGSVRYAERVVTEEVNFIVGKPEVL